MKGTAIEIAIQAHRKMIEGINNIKGHSTEKAISIQEHEYSIEVLEKLKPIERQQQIDYSLWCMVNVVKILDGYFIKSFKWTCKNEEELFEIYTKHVNKA